MRLRLHEVARWRLNYQHLPLNHQRLLGSMQAKIDAAGSCIATNQRFILAMLAAFDDVEEGGPDHLMHANAAGDEAIAADHRISPADADKVQREWGGGMEGDRV